jgi:uncharacterized protein
VEVLERIRRAAPDYFHRHVTLSICLDVNNDVREVFDYFNTGPMREVNVRASVRWDRDTTAYQVSPENEERFRQGLGAIADMYLRSLRETVPFHYRLFTHLFQTVFDLARDRQTGYATVEQPPNGACLPGESRIFVTTDGVFYPCERACPRGYAIGDYRTGLQVDQVRRLLEPFVHGCETLCQECWAFRLCRLCYMHCMESGTLSEKGRREGCERQKSLILGALKTFIRLWENEPESAHSNPHSLHYAARSLGKDRCAWT